LNGNAQSVARPGKIELQSHIRKDAPQGCRNIRTMEEERASGRLTAL
jgi:hypothetical protein